MTSPGEYVRSLSSIKKQALATARARLDGIDAIVTRLRDLLREDHAEHEARRRIRELQRLAVELDEELDAFHTPAPRQREDVARAVQNRGSGGGD